MTADQVRTIIRAAALVAGSPPRKFKPYAYLTNVPIEAIQALRAALDDAGVDWGRVRDAIEDGQRASTARAVARSTAIRATKEDG